MRKSYTSPFIIRYRASERAMK